MRSSTLRRCCSLSPAHRNRPAAVSHLHVAVRLARDRAVSARRPVHVSHRQPRPAKTVALRIAILTPLIIVSGVAVMFTSSLFLLPINQFLGPEYREMTTPLARCCSWPRIAARPGPCSTCTHADELALLLQGLVLVAARVACAIVVYMCVWQSGAWRRRAQGHRDLHHRRACLVRSRVQDLGRRVASHGTRVALIAHWRIAAGRTGRRPRSASSRRLPVSVEPLECRSEPFLGGHFFEARTPRGIEPDRVGQSGLSR